MREFLRDLEDEDCMLLEALLVALDEHVGGVTQRLLETNRDVINFGMKFLQPYVRGGMLFRGLRLPRRGLRSVEEFLLEDMKTFLHESDQPSSWSRSLDVAYSFAQGSARYGEDSFGIVLSYRAGVNDIIFDLSDLSKHFLLEGFASLADKEDEVILFPGSYDAEVVEIL